MKLSVICSVVLAACVGCGASAQPEPGTTSGTQEVSPAAAEPAPVAAASPSEAAPHFVLITDAAGAPLPAASAVIVSGAYELLQGTSAAPLRPDPRGRLALTLSRERLADALLLIWAPGHASLRFAIDPTGEHVEARLPDATPLRGRLVGARHRVDHIWLDTTDSEAAWPSFVRCDVDDDGRFSVLGLEAATYRVRSLAIGGAPVLSADREGRVQFLAVEPPREPVHEYRLLDREITADGEEHALRVAFGRVMVVGEVTDESGGPIAGARVEFSSESPGRLSTLTDDLGHFEAAVPPGPILRIAASHADYGQQWTDYEWHSWSQYDEMPSSPVHLMLRRGAVLRGRLVDQQGAPRANLRLLMIPAYVGSGPATLDVRTDAEGRFAFERAVLNHFELVPLSLDEWPPQASRRPGAHVRIVDERDAWLARAAAGEPVELRLESYTVD